MTKLVTDKCPCCGTRGLNPKKIKDMCENCLETSFDQWRRKVAFLEKENAELKKENKELDTFDRTQSYKLLLRIDELKAVIRSMMNEESKYTLDELEKLLEDK